MSSRLLAMSVGLMAVLMIEAGASCAQVAWAEQGPSAALGLTRSLPQFPVVVGGPLGTVSTFAPDGRSQIRISPLFARSFAVSSVGTIDTMGLNDLCYKMRSYIFAREDGGDATRLVKQQTCTPASKLRLKKARPAIIQVVPQGR